MGFISRRSNHLCIIWNNLHHSKHPILVATSAAGGPASVNATAPAATGAQAAVETAAAAPATEPPSAANHSLRQHFIGDEGEVPGEPAEDDWHSHDEVQAARLAGAVLPCCGEVPPVTRAPRGVQPPELKPDRGGTAPPTHRHSYH